MEHEYNCNMNFALTYSMRRPRLAAECCVKAFFAALAMGSPRRMWAANELLGIVNRGL
jgi:hypothetical protein